MVVYDDASQKGGLMAAASSAISGHTSGLPDTYGLAPADLARLMQQWRERAIAPR